jgi:hypothetical protein
LVKNSGNNAVGGFGKKQVCALLWFTHIIWKVKLLKNNST